MWSVEIRDARDALRRLPSDGGELAVFEAFDAAWNRYKDSSAHVIEQLERGEISVAMHAFQTETTKIFDEALNQLDRAIHLTDARTQRIEVNMSAMRDRAYGFIVLAVSAALLVVVFAMVWLARRVINPLREITNALESLTEGDNDAPIKMSGSTYANEIDVLVSAASSYRESLIQTRVFAGQLEAERNDAMAMRNEALEANRAKSLLLANVSHELRTPMNAICGFSDMMLSELYGPMHPPRYAEYVQGIHTSARILINNIDDLLDFSRLQVNKFTWDSEEINVHEEVADVTATCRASFPRRNILLERDETNLDVLVVGDRSRLGQALINLIGNAVKFSEDDTDIAVRVGSSGGGTVTVSVKDQGCGIANEDIDLVFRPFGQAKADSFTASRGGLGLGLAITREIVERFDGCLKLESKIGVGTIASIELPVAAESEDRAA